MQLQKKYGVNLTVHEILARPGLLHVIHKLKLLRYVVTTKARLPSGDASLGEPAQNMLTVSCRLGVLHALHSKTNSVSL